MGKYRTISMYDRKCKEYLEHLPSKTEILGYENNKVHVNFLNEFDRHTVLSLALIFIKNKDYKVLDSAIKQAINITFGAGYPVTCYINILFPDYAYFKKLYVTDSLTGEHPFRNFLNILILNNIHNINKVLNKANVRVDRITDSYELKFTTIKNDRTRKDNK